VYDDTRREQLGIDMNCPRCGFENPDGMHFCGKCGAELARTCPSCGCDNPPDFGFCGKCGRGLAAEARPAPAPERDPRSYTPKHLADKILQSKSALEGERKQLSVLFADVKGSMDLAEQVDPEEWHRILNRFFQILTDGIHRFEGTVNQYTGDGIMALFGAPIAHEDHAQRACYAALHLSAELRRYADELRLGQGLSFAVRMGLNSGEVVVGKIGDDLRMDYTAQGPTVGLAARMQEIAEPGRVYLTHYTARLVEGFFQLRDLGQSKVKGVAEPLRVHELEGVGPMRTRLDVARSRGFFRFVGRADEMAALEATLQRAADGNGQVVGVVGEAGVGKSRLCLEFIERVRAKGVPIYEAHCPSHGKVIPFLPVFELLRAYFGISAQDNDPTVRQKIAGRLLLLDRSLDKILPVFFDFLGVPDSERPAPPMDPEARQRQLFSFVRRLVQDRPAAEPVVILVDDLHWIDAGSDAFLAELVEAASGTRTLMLVNFRPDYHASWMGRSHYQQLPLVPLGPEAVEELLGDLLGGDPSVAGLTDLIRERTGGNPFFIEEVVQSMVESGSLAGARGAYQLAKSVGELEIPATVQSLLAARIDRLAEREKQVLQRAAVLGKKFSESVLKQVIELPDLDLAASLDVLQRSEFIYEEALYPAAEYAFKHPLTQEVAYTSQLTDRRRNTHAAAARAIVELYPERLDEQAALLAHHWEEAGETLEAARWHARAATWAGYSDIAESVRHWQRVYELSAALPEDEDSIRLRLTACTWIMKGSWRLGLSEQDVDRLYTEGSTLAEALEDDEAARLLRVDYRARLLTTARLSEAIVAGREALAEADALGDPRSRAGARIFLAYAYYCVGRVREALQLVEQGVEISQSDVGLGKARAGFSPLIWFLLSRPWLKPWLGHLEGAREELERSVRLAREEDDAENLGWALGSALVINAEFSGNLSFGSLGDVRACALEAVETAEKMGSHFSSVTAYEGLGTAQLLHEEWEEAQRFLERALELTRLHHTGLEREAGVLARLARAQLGAGDARRALSTAEKAIALARSRGQAHVELIAEVARARSLVRDRGAEARSAICSALDRAQSLAEDLGLRGCEPQILEARAELARLLGDQAEYQRELREAHHLYVEMGATGHAERLAKELGL
jgi:class 3 adenylate cyclase/tetratricopeptide (TPR) repeat protein